ncbi:hypothetical protein MNBD_GAMMA01-1164, partial [hydrothermal vent metagenome]
MNFELLKKGNLVFLLFITVTTLFIYTSDLPPQQAHTLFITLITASLWITEKLPIPVSSLIPIAAFPLFGILDSKLVAQSYGSPLIL